MAGRLKDTTVEAVRQAADLVRVAEERTALRKAGTQYTGRCPFHEERTPSFSVDPSKGLYYCFGCGKGGDVFTFVRETQGLDFVGAVEWLGERFHVPLEYDDSSPRQDAARQRRRRLFELLDQAAQFYERLLWDSQAGSYARDYLTGRGLGEEVGGAMLALRSFMFEHVYLGPQTRPEHERARATVRCMFDALADRGGEPDEITEFIAGMTDRYALDYAAVL